MCGVQGSFVRRKTNPHNYAVLNKVGFCSARAVRTKKIVRKKVMMSSSLPSSPTEAGSEVEFTNKDGGADPFCTHVVTVTPSRSVDCDSKNPTKNLDNINSHFVLPETSMDLSDLEGLPLDEKKKLVQQRITEMEQQLQQPQEVDDELLQLLQKQDELKRKLSEKPGANKPAQGSNKTSKKGKVVSRKPTLTLVEVADDSINAMLNNVVGASLDRIPTLSEIKDLLHVTDKKSKVKKARRTHKKRKHSKRKHDSFESESETLSSEKESSSEEDTSDSEPEPRRKRTGKKQSGLYAKAGNVNLVLDEVFAHTALDDEIGERNLESLPFHLLVAGELEIISDK